MKNILLLVLCLGLSNSLWSQTTLDDIVWPMSASVPSCFDLPEEYPYVPNPEPEDRFQYSFTNHYLPDTSTSCLKVLVDWFALDWITSELVDSIVIYNVDQGLGSKSIPTSKYTADLNGGVITVIAEDLVVDPIDGHIYSFSSYDENNNTVDVQNGVSKVVRVFDATESAWHNATHILPDLCEEGWAFEHKEEQFISTAATDIVGLDASSWDDGSYFNCGSFEIRMSLDNEDFTHYLELQPEAGTTTIYLKYITSTGYELTHQVVLNISIVGDYVFTKYIESLSVSVGDTVEVAIWSTDIDSLVGFGYSLDIAGAEVIGISDEHPIFGEGNVYHSFIDGTYRVIWIDPLNTSSIIKDDIWYKIQLVSNIDGSTEEIFSWANPALEHEFIIQDDVALVLLGSQFSYEMASRGVSGTSTPIDYDLKIYPVPTDDRLNISSANFGIPKVEIFTSSGSLVISCNSVSNDGVDVSELSPGVYVVTVHFDDGNTLSQQLLKR